MSIHVSNLTDFKAIIQNQADARLIVVDFHATWCGPCHAIAPQFENLASRYASRARFLKVDVDEAQDIASFSSVSAMPTFHFYRQGRRVAQFSGADPRRLEATIEEHAPTSASVAFSGQGQRLSSTSDPSSAQGPPSSSSSLRDIAAAAAARRLQSTPKPDADLPSSSDAAPANGNDPRLKVNQVLLKQLTTEIGFPPIRAEKALIFTGNKSLEAAVDWCFEHADDPDIDEPLQVVAPDGAPKPQLTPEEAKKKADELFARARAKRETEEKRQAIEREKDRIKSGKEVTSSRAKLEAEARKRAVEERLQQKREALAERQRVRQMLEADKERRRQRFNMPGPPPPVPETPTPQPPQRAPVASANVGKIQFRLPDGSRLEGEFRAEQTMSDILAFLTQQKPELATRSITFSQQYPRKIYSQSDFQFSLGELGLLPRGALMVTLS